MRALFLDELRASAQAVAAGGWLVFPLHSVSGSRCTCSRDDCPSPGKHPRTAHGLKEATADHAQIAQWWRDYQTANIGCRTGKESGLVVIDIDPRHGGDATWETLVQTHGGLPETVECLTGGGGRHLYFRHPGGHIKTQATALGPGVDVRADGGYVVLPPSLHASGRRYEWEASSRPGEIPLADLPAWLLDHLRTPAPAVSHPSDGQTIMAGERNNHLTKVGGALRRHYAGRDVLEVTLMAVNRTHCSPPLPDAEVSRIAASVSRYPPGAERQTSFTTSLPYIGSEAVKLVDPVELNSVVEPGPRIDLVAGLIPEGHTTLLYGDGGQGKSFLALALASCVAMGRPFATVGTKQTGVLMLDWELDLEEHSRRAYRIARGLGLDRPPGGLFYLRSTGSFGQTIAQLKQFIMIRGIGLLIVDSFGAACGGNPEAAEFVISFMASALRAAQVTVLALDHQAKTQEGQQYTHKTPFGSAYKFNLARSVIQCQKIAAKPGELALVLRPTKANLSALREPIPLRLCFEAMQVRIEVGDMATDPTFAEYRTVEEKILANLQEQGPSSTKTLADRTGLHGGTVANKLAGLKKKDLIREVGRQGHAPIYEANVTASLPYKGSETVKQIPIQSAQRSSAEAEPAIRAIQTEFPGTEVVPPTLGDKKKGPGDQ